jgi:hypothetical protein
VLSDGARALRLATWGALGAGLALVAAGLAGFKGWLPREMGAPALWLSMAAAAAACWLGYRARQRVIADRDREGSRTMILLVAAQLGRQDDEALERMVQRGGPAAEAAAMILEGRQRARRSEALRQAATE